jgi:nucleoside-diphosphate-sugar epimerase
MTAGLVAVFGGTGFLGRRIVRHLRSREYTVRIASRHPERRQRLFGTDDPHIQSVKANVRDERSVTDAIAGAHTVVNAVSLYVEHGDETFHSIHVEAAQRVAVQAQRAGIKHLLHVSGIGSDPRSRSLYIRKRGEGELAVVGAFANAIIIRPAVMFGPDDAFLTTILNLLRRFLNLPNVRQRRDTIATGLCRRCSRGHRQSGATDGNKRNHIRVLRPAHLYLRGTSQNYRSRSRVEAHPDSGSIRRLAGIGVDRGDDAKSAYHSESSGADAGRQRVLV